MKTLRALDLFSGGGGISIGLERAGFDVDGVELEPFNVAMQRLNGLKCEQGDVLTYHPKRTYDLVAGGPPCPAFSYAGLREGTSCDKGMLYEQLIRIALEADAKVVMMENVQGLITSRKGKDFEQVVDTFKQHGFTVQGRVMDTSHYGVPQARKRVVLVATRDGIDFEFPEPSKRRISVREALYLRGKYASGRLDRAQSSKNGKERGWWQGGRGLDVEKPGFTVGTRDNYDLLVPIDETAEAEVAAMRARGGRKASEMGYRLDSEELKVLQGAPDYVLQGKKSERHYAVGNMVPPPLAEAVGRQIRKALER